MPLLLLLLLLVIMLTIRILLMMMMMMMMMMPMMMMIIMILVFSGSAQGTRPSQLGSANSARVHLTYMHIHDTCFKQAAHTHTRTRMP